ncbi:MAG: MFS transporter [Polyangiaceae bacterium]
MSEEELVSNVERPSTEVRGARFLSSFVERVPDPNMWRIYGITLALGTAYGMAISVLGIFLNASGFKETDIGKLAVWFAAGIVALSLPMGPLARRFSNKRLLALSLAGYAVAITLFPFLHSFTAIAALRFFDGACSVGVWVNSESILLSRSGNKNKAFATSLYAIAVGCGYVLGPALAWLFSAFPIKFIYIAAGAISICISAYVLLRLDPDLRHEPEAEHTGRQHAAGGSTLSLLWRIKTSCFGTFAYGYFQASVVLFLPVFLVNERGISGDSTKLIPAFFAAGMLLFSNYAGRLGDRHGHLLIMRGLGLIGMTMVLGFAWLTSFPLMCVAVFIAGASLASISPVSLALQGMIVHPSEYERSTSLYNALYAAGMLLGPPISSYLLETRGGAVMLEQLALMWVAFVVFAFVFRADDPVFLQPASRSAVR